MDNLCGEKFDEGGAGIFDLEYTNMLTTLTQFVNNFTRKQFENGMTRGTKYSLWERFKETTTK